MTREEAIQEVNKVFEPAFANYIITALTEGATISDKEEGLEELLDSLQKANATNAKLIKLLEGKQEPCEDAVSRAEVIDELNRLGRNAFKDDTDYDNFFTFLDSLKPVTPTFPKGATNGDMIKAMFPNVNKYHNMLLENHSKNILFNDDWWNAPYKKEVEE